MARSGHCERLPTILPNAYKFATKIYKTLITLTLNTRALAALTLHSLILSTERPAACYAIARAAELSRSSAKWDSAKCEDTLRVHVA